MKAVFHLHCSFNVDGDGDGDGDRDRDRDGDCTWLDQKACFPRPFAHAEIFFLRPCDFLPAAWIFSANFSQTRGTPKNKVGRTARRDSPKLPFRASGRAKVSEQGLEQSAVVTIGKWTEKQWEMKKKECREAKA